MSDKPKLTVIKGNKNPKDLHYARIIAKLKRKLESLSKPK